MKSCAANELNQYTAIANPDAVGLRGSATNTATVTVNGNAASRDNIASDTVPWHYALQADNANEGKYTFAEIFAVVNPPGTNTPDLVSTASGSVYAPPQQETLAYDDDGNLLSDGRWQYTWNGENRLVKAEEVVAPATRQPYVVEYAYDHQGRMVRKTVAAPNSPPSKTIAYLWDGFNIVAETVVENNATSTTYNVWGLDLDGTLQGAGGVGGLLAVVKDSATYVPAWDGNGNIIEYVSSDGIIVAHREYDPFGGTVVASGNADTFTHWFSTKPWCKVTKLSEYQFRKFSSITGNWISRDVWDDPAHLMIRTIVNSRENIPSTTAEIFNYIRLIVSNMFFVRAVSSQETEFEVRKDDVFNDSVTTIEGIDETRLLLHCWSRPQAKVPNLFDQEEIRKIIVARLGPTLAKAFQEFAPEPNLYGFVSNNTGNKWDVLGMISTHHGQCCAPDIDFCYPADPNRQCPECQYYRPAGGGRSGVCHQFIILPIVAVFAWLKTTIKKCIYLKKQRYTSPITRLACALLIEARSNSCIEVSCVKGKEVHVKLLDAANNLTADRYLNHELFSPLVDEFLRLVRLYSLGKDDAPPREPVEGVFDATIADVKGRWKISVDRESDVFQLYSLGHKDC